jgi:LacI family transcriptional regulator
MKKQSSHSTLTDVARAAGVGTTTVSRVINGGERVSQETLARVQAVIEELGYQPSQAARILRGERTKTIGLIVPSIADSFFSTVTEVAQEIARAHDSLLIVTVSNNDPSVELENLNVLIRHRTDGLLLAPAHSENRSLANMLDKLSIPSVTFDRPLYDSAVPSVVSNNYKGAKAATQHLIMHGCKRILCLGGETGLYTIKERIRGYKEAVKQAGLDAIIDTSIKDYKSAESAIESHFCSSNPPDAVFALKNLATIYACEVFQKLNINVPKKVALIGFDASPIDQRRTPAHRRCRKDCYRTTLRSTHELQARHAVPWRQSQAATYKAGKSTGAAQLLWLQNRDELRAVIQFACRRTTLFPHLVVLVVVGRFAIRLRGSSLRTS